MDAYLKSQNITFKPTYKFNSYSLCHELIKIGFGIGIGNPSHYNEEEFMIIKTNFKLPTRTFDIGYIKPSKNKYINEITQMLNKKILIQNSIFYFIVQLYLDCIHGFLLMFLHLFDNYLYNYVCIIININSFCTIKNFIQSIIHITTIVVRYDMNNKKHINKNIQKTRSKILY